MKAKFLAAITIAATISSVSCNKKNYSSDNLLGYWIIDSITNNNDVDDPLTGLKFSSLAFQSYNQLPVKIEFATDSIYKIPDTTEGKYLQDKYYFDSGLQTLYINDATVYSPWKLKQIRDSAISLSHDSIIYYMHKN